MTDTKTTFALLGWLLAAIGGYFSVSQSTMMCANEKGQALSDRTADNVSTTLQTGQKRAQIPDANKPADPVTNEADKPEVEHRSAASRLENAFRDDGDAGAESAVMEQNIWGAFSELEPLNVQINDLSCKSSMCRVSVYLPDIETDHQAFERIFDYAGGVFRQYQMAIPERETMADGSIKALVFITRPEKEPDAEFWTQG